MSIALIVALIFTASLILGPMMMMRPNPAQKNKENLRMTARKNGVHFSMRNLPRQADDLESPSVIPVYFLSPEKSQTEPGWLLIRANYEHEINLLGWWGWQSEVRATAAELEILRAQLPSLPESVKAVSSGAGGICVYWEEKGGEPALQQIISLLNLLKAAIPNPR